MFAIRGGLSIECGLVLTSDVGGGSAFDMIGMWFAAYGEFVFNKGGELVTVAGAD